MIAEEKLELFGVIDGEVNVVLVGKQSRVPCAKRLRCQKQLHEKKFALELPNGTIMLFNLPELKKLIK